MSAYRAFVVAQRINQNFIKLNNEIIQLKAELKNRSQDYMSDKHLTNRHY